MKKLLPILLIFFAANSVQGQSLCTYYLDLSHYYTGMKDFEKAIFYANKSLKMYPDSSRAYLERGGAYYFSGQLDEAYIDLDTYVGLNPNDDEGYYWRGMILSESRVWDEAISDLKKSLQLGGEDEFTEYKLGEALYYFKEYKEAKSIFLKLIEKDPQSIYYYNYLGLICKSSGDNKESINYFSKGITVDSSYVSFYYNRAHVYMTIGEKEKACDDLHKSMELGAEDTDIWLEINNCNGEMGNSEADIHYDKVHRFNGKKSEIQTLLIDASYFPMRRHARYTFVSQDMDTTAMAVLYNDPKSNEYYFDNWFDLYTDFDALYFELCHTNDFYYTEKQLDLLMPNENLERVHVQLFPQKFTIGKEHVIKNTWNTKPLYEISKATISLEGIESFQMPDKKEEQSIKLRILVEMNNGTSKLSYLWLVKNFGIVKWRNSAGKTWELIRFAVPEYGSFPPDEKKFLMPPPAIPED